MNRTDTPQRESRTNRRLKDALPDPAGIHMGRSTLPAGSGCPSGDCGDGTVNATVVDQVAEALDMLLESDSTAELRVPKTRHGTASGYFDDFSKLAAAATVLDGTAPGIYVTINPVRPNLLSRSRNRVEQSAKQATKDQDIVRRRWLPIDLDPVRVSLGPGHPKGVSSTDQEHERAIEKAREVTRWLRERGWPEPVLADSGNGGHLLFRIDLPNDAQSHHLVKRCLEAIAERFGDDLVSIDTAVSNAARIWKLYGTVARKGETTSERPHRRSSILDLPQNLQPVAREQLEQLAALAPRRQDKRSPRNVRAARCVEASGSAYGQKALNEELDRVRTVPETTRNISLNRAAFSLGQLEAGGELPSGTSEPLLYAAAEANGLVEDDGVAQTRATIRSGLDAGRRTPRSAPPEAASQRSRVSQSHENTANQFRVRIEEDADAHKTELGLARRFVRQHRANLHYCAPWATWLVWDGMRWASDRTLAITALMKETVKALYVEAITDDDAERRTKQVTFALKCEKESVIRAATTLARSEPGIPITPEALNHDANLLVTPNGTVDLRTGEIRDNRREDLITKLCPTPYDPDASAPTWERFLLRIFDNKLTMILFVQRVLGYALTGTAKEHVLFMFIGRGRNGKSTLMGAAMFVVGRDYSIQIAPNLLFNTRKDTHPTALADLDGKRLAVTHELDGGTKLAEGLVKQATGGDSIRARRMRQDFWQFDPTHTLILCSNTKPVIRGSDEGIWRRIRVVPFPVQIPKSEEDRDLPAKLRDEAAGILTWLVQGARDWAKIGLNETEEVRKATASYRSESDVVGEFIEVACVVDDDASVKATTLYDAFKSWYAGDNSDDPPSQRWLGFRLTDRGFERKRRRDGIWYRGIRPDDRLREPCEPCD